MGGGGVFSIDSLSGIYVLVVDAEKDRRALLTGILRYCGALVTPVETPDNALAVMDILTPDVVVVDFSATTDGAAQMLERLRAHEDLRRTVAVVAVGESGLNDVARERGFDAYVEKPFDAWELCRVISSLLTI
jgi:adenylate cyclase